MPELISSVLAVLKNSSEIVVGNVVGSNITNVFLILGVVAVVGRKLDITYELINVDLPLFIGSAFLLAATIWDGTFSRSEALLCIAGFGLYFFYILSVEKEHKHDLPLEREIALDKRVTAMLIFSSILIYAGARYTVESIIQISELLDIGKEIIAASAVAFGTSLPELFVSASAARNGKPELAVGNVLGSNIFNALAVMGVSAMFGPLIIPVSITSFALPLMLAATLLYVFMTQDKQITQWEGGLLIIFYVFYLGKLLGLF
jgi:cation:H+ antiporter